LISTRKLITASQQPMRRSALVLLALTAAPSLAAVARRRPCLASASLTRQIASPATPSGAAATTLAKLHALRGGALLTVSESPSVNYAVQILLASAAVGSALLLSSFLRMLYLVTSANHGHNDAGLRSRRWSVLKDHLLLSGSIETVASGVAAEHAGAARTEACRKLVMNHERVLHDLTRADGPPLTQKGLVRLPGKVREVDVALLELAHRLFGRIPGERATPVGHPATVEQQAVWAATASYLNARVQATPQEMQQTPGHEQREPDMSPPAAAAMRAVLLEMKSEKAPAAFGQTFKTAFRPFASSAGTAIRAPTPVAA